MRTLICGSIAFDTIMVFGGRFKEHILPDQIHILNVSFQVPEMRREFGGCAGNIAYNLRLLGGAPVIMATVGEDVQPYEERLDDMGIAREHMRRVPGTFTAQAFITTDMDDNQITAFHPGAMNHSHANSVNDASDVGLGIVAPDGREGMLVHARQFREAGVPFVFDPGQGLPLFNGEDLLSMIDAADYVAANDYEARVMVERTGKPLASLAQRVKAFVVTRGADGSTIHAGGQQIDIPSVKAEAVVDPTGCGDAYRAGLLYGIANGMPWDDTGRLASLMGALKVAKRGAQNHVASRGDIEARFRAAFGHSPW
jgi:adenosine kinase